MGLSAVTHRLCDYGYRSRLRGVQHRAISRANSYELTELEEETLQKWILSLDDRGAAPRPTTVRETANLLL
jgi:hypothetical protein